VALVTVRSFAALREIAGPIRDAEASSVAELLRDMTAELGDEFARRLARSKVVVDGDPTTAHDEAPLREGAEIVLLPPFAGG
jgi:molybdopterin converting factor small subunit